MIERKIYRTDFILILFIMFPALLFGANKKLDSVFIAMNPSRTSWSQHHWDVEFENLRSIGINTVIINAACTATTAMYPGCSLEGALMSGNALDKVFQSADSTGMKVVLGLYYDSDWWTKMADITYLHQLYEKNTAVFNDLWSRYSSSSSLMGWYIVQEIDNNMFKWEVNRVKFVDTFLRPLTQDIHSKSPSFIICTAPYFYPSGASARDYGDWWIKTFTDVPHLNLLIPQDGIGAGGYPFSFVTSYFNELKRACDSTGRMMWSDLEIFDNTTTWVSASISRVTTQLEIEKPYVLAFTCWEYSYYMSPLEGSLQEKLYSDYLQYLYGISSGYRNIAKGKNYSLIPTPSITYSDNGNKLTDGTSFFNYQINIGWSSSTVNPVIILDLGEVKDDIFEIRGNSMRSDSASVDTVKFIELSISNNGLDYVYLGQMNAIDTNDQSLNIFQWKGDSISTRYIKMLIKRSSNRWVFINEIIVNQYNSLTCLRDWDDYVYHE